MTTKQAQWIEVTRRFEFCAGHRLLGHEGKCRFMHGHNYVAEVTVQSRELDDLGMVVDFGVVKDKVGEWIDRNWDHAFIYNRDDEEVMKALVCLEDQNAYSMPLNPTAEVMASYLIDICRSLIPLPLNVTRVRLWETPKCYAEVTRGS